MGGIECGLTAVDADHLAVFNPCDRQIVHGKGYCIAAAEFIAEIHRKVDVCAVVDRNVHVLQCHVHRGDEIKVRILQVAEEPCPHELRIADPLLHDLLLHRDQRRDKAVIPHHFGEDTDRYVELFGLSDAKADGLTVEVGLFLGELIRQVGRTPQLNAQGIVRRGRSAAGIGHGKPGAEAVLGLIGLGALNLIGRLGCQGFGNEGFDVTVVSLAGGIAHFLGDRLEGEAVHVGRQRVLEGVGHAAVGGKRVGDLDLIDQRFVRVEAELVALGNVHAVVGYFDPNGYLFAAHRQGNGDVVLRSGLVSFTVRVGRGLGAIERDVLDLHAAAGLHGVSHQGQIGDADGNEVYLPVILDVVGGFNKRLTVAVVDHHKVFTGHRHRQLVVAETVTGDPIGLGPAGVFGTDNRFAVLVLMGHLIGDKSRTEDLPCFVPVFVRDAAGP